MDPFHEAYHFLKHLLLAKKRHGVHSPLVYLLSDQVLDSSRHFGVFDELEKIRASMICDEREIEVLDLGAGSRTSKGSNRKISNIAKVALAPRQQSQALFKLAAHFQPHSILELGTSLGLTTMYLASVNRKSRVTTIEGAPEVARVAQENFDKYQFPNIRLIQNSFDAALENLSPGFDWIYIDGNHRLEPTLRYFERCKELLSPQGILILDDIYWSKEMTTAWEKACADGRFNLALDFYHFGVLIRDNRKEKEYFRLRF
jgi:predicted O-methyltransferase YrrM